jgi:F0F1-type ATP synthase membrane subunit c/vacuolar-type H+-ATPase subunit K
MRRWALSLALLAAGCATTGGGIGQGTAEQAVSQQATTSETQQRA